MGPCPSTLHDFKLMFKKTIFFVIAILWQQLPAFSCSCIWTGSFVEASANQPLIIRGRIQQYGAQIFPTQKIYTEMDIEVLDVIRGNYSQPTLKLLGDPGHLCRPYISQTAFPLQGEFLFAVQIPERNKVPLSACGEFYLQVKDQSVRGKKLKDGKLETYTQPYQSLIKSLSGG